MLCLIERIEEFGNLKSQISDLKLAAEGISRQLRAWADSLQNTGIKGQRYLTEKGRRAEEVRADRKRFLDELEAIRKGSPPTAISH